MLQSNVVRTNCMDNLDRTNVVQSDIAKWSLNRQLQTMGYLSQGETIDDHDELLHLFRNSQSLSARALMVMMNLLYLFQCGRIMQTPSVSRTVVQAHSKLILRVRESGHSLVIWQTGSTPPRGISRITIMTDLDRCVPASHYCGVRRTNILDLG